MFGISNETKEPSMKMDNEEDYPNEEDPPATEKVAHDDHEKSGYADRTKVMVEQTHQTLGNRP
jgi:hypothetical protein